MPNEISAHIRQVKVAGAGLVLVLALAIVGLVWLSLSAVSALRLQFSGPTPELIVGLVCLAPLVIFLIRQKLKSQAKHEVQELHAPHNDLANISHIAQGLVEKSPFTALAIAALAGVLAVRFPSALTLLLQVLNPQNHRPETQSRV